MIGLVEKVYSANDENEKEAFGRELRDAIQDFLGDFLHHMEEEEQVEPLHPPFLTNLQYRGNLL